MTTDIETDDILKQFIIEPEWHIKENINPNLFLFYEKIYIIHLSKPNKTFVGTLVSANEYICNFSNINNQDDVLSLIYDDNEEFSSMIIKQKHKNKEFEYNIEDIYIVDTYSPEKNDYEDYQEIEFIEDNILKKNYTKKIIVEDLLSHLIKQYDALDNPIKIDKIRNLTDNIYKLINTKIHEHNNFFDWLIDPISNLIPKAYIPITDANISADMSGFIPELVTLIDTLNNINKQSYQDKIKIINSWLNRFIPNSSPTFDEYNGYAYLNDKLIEISHEIISITNIIEIPPDKLLYSNNMTLLEKIVCNDIFYNNISHIQRYNNYKLNGGNWNSIIQDLKTQMNNIDEFIDNIINLESMNFILNLNELDYILNKYNITLNRLSKKNRHKIYTKIEDNCKNYISNSPKKYNVENKSKTKHTIDHYNKLLLAKKYIFSQVQNNDSKLLLRRFIDVYTRNPDKIQESNLWYYDIFNDKPILCKHYHYYINSNNSNNSFTTMINIFGTDPKDGCIFCKNCGEFLSLEEFSTLSGFKDDQPISQNAQIVTKDTSTDIINDPINDKIIALIDLFSTIFNISVDESFKIDLIDIYLYIDSKQLSSIRYNNNDISTKPIHPRIKADFEDINKSIVETKKKSLRKELESDKSDLFESFQLWLHDTNRFISVLCIFILLNQCQSLNVKKNIEIISTDSREINHKILTYIHSKIIKSIKYIDDKRLNYLNTLLLDEKLPCNNLEKQLLNSFNYIKNIPIILDKYQKYIILLQTKQHNYIREEWDIYKPLHNNILIQDVRNLINANIQTELLLKKYGNFKVQNISLIRPITQNTSIAKLCKIPSLEIIQNPAFIQFLRLCTSCYGIHPPNTYINLLVSRIIDTVQNPEIKNIFKKYGFNNSFKKLNFSIFRNKLIPDILKSYPNQTNNIIRSCFDDEESCNELIHISINTYDLPLLNTYPKRHYSYYTLTVFPDKPYNYYNDYNKENPDNKINIVGKLFDNYVYNSVNDIVINSKFNILSQDKIFETPINIYKSIPNNNDNFYTLLNIKTVFPIPSKHDSPNTNKLIHSYIHNLNASINIGSKEPLEYIENTLNNINESTNSDKFNSQQINTGFSDLISSMNEQISRISSYISSSQWITNEQITKLSSFIKGNFNTTNINELLIKFIMDPQYTYQYIFNDIQHIRLVFINIITNHSYKFNSQWKFTEANKDKFNQWILRNNDDESFITKTELLLHDRVFLYGSKDNYPGFNQYSGNKHIEILFNKISSIFKNIDSIKPDENSFYNSTYSNIMIKNIFVEILYLILKYIENIQNSVTDIDDDANELFLSLNITEEDFKQEGIDICSRFLMDLINDLLLMHYDPSWIFQNKSKNDLNNRLSKQREREKLLHLSRLTDVTKDQRFIADQKQKIGLSNMWKQGAIDCEKFINSEEASLLNEAERKEKLNEILQDNGVTPQDYQVINLQPKLSNDDYELQEGYNYLEDNETDDDTEQGIYDEELSPVNNI